MVLPIIRTRSDPLPEQWYNTVEQGREKAKRLINNVVAVDQSTSVIVGKLLAVEIDRLWELKYPYCKLTISKPLRFRQNGNFDCNMGEIELFFINKPQMLMAREELKERFPKVFNEILGKIKTDFWG